MTKILVKANQNQLNESYIKQNKTKHIMKTNSKQIKCLKKFSMAFKKKMAQ